MKYAIYAGTAIAVVALFFVLYIGVKSYWDERSDYVRTAPTMLSRHPERTGIAGLREISFAAAGDPPVAAWYAPGTNRAAVILVHGVGADRSALVAETRFLADAGFAVLALDLPGQGASGGETFWGVPERRAISAAVDWLGQRPEVDPRRIGAFGMSMGSYVLVQAAALDQRLRAVVLGACPHDVVEFNWEATSRWGWLSQLPTYWALRAGGTPVDMLPKDIIASIAPRPIMILHGDLDGLIPVSTARLMFAAAHEPKELYIVHGAHHADFSTTKQALPEYRSHLVDFFERSLVPAR